MKLINILLLFIGLTSCYSNRSQNVEADFTPLDSMVNCWINRNYYPGASIAVSNKDTLLFEKYYGTYLEDTEVYVASAGKWLVAATIAAVVEHTDLSWDDRIDKWLPEFGNGAKASITLRQLMSHTSGIPSYHKSPQKDVYNSLDSAVMDILPLDTIFSPGTRFKYGGLSMQVAGRMAEKAGKTNFETLFKQYIGVPLNMENTYYTPVDTSEGHSPMLAGGARTTLHDYMRFLNMIFHDGMYQGRRILSIESIREMQADQIGDAQVASGEYVEKALGYKHSGIYGLGEWREKVDCFGNAYQISSPSWAGAYPWINKRDGVYGFFLAHVAGNSAAKDNFSPFYNAPLLSGMVSKIIGKRN